MRAVVLSAPRSDELVNDWPEPEPGPQDVIVAIRGIGLCGSDLSVFDGTRPAPRLPWVIGHEGGGDIVAVGQHVHDREVGQRVVIEPNYPCLTCRRARASGVGRVRAGGVERDVTFTEPPTDAHPDIDAAYHAKYDRYGPAIVGTVVGEQATKVTRRVVPRDT